MPPTQSLQAPEAVLVASDPCMVSGPASAKSKKQVCIDEGANEYLFVGKIPGKNKCGSFQVVDTFGIYPGLMQHGPIRAFAGCTVLHQTRVNAERINHLK